MSETPLDNRIDEGITISEQPIIPIVPSKPVNPDEMSDVMKEMGITPAPASSPEDVFEEIPAEMCGALYSSALEITVALKKGVPRQLPKSRIKTQGDIIYQILKRNQISVKHIDIFMLAAGIVADYKYVSSNESGDSDE